MPDPNRSLPQKLETVVGTVLGVPESSLRDESELKQMPAWDSMTHIILITRLEKDFGIEFTGDEIADMKTLGDVRRFLCRHGVDE